MKTKHTPAPWKVVNARLIDLTYLDGRLHKEGIEIDIQQELTNQHIVSIKKCIAASEEAKANAKLIAASPELLEETKESIVDLKILSEQLLKESEFNQRFHGMYEIMRNWIERKEKLIKKATE